MNVLRRLLDDRFAVAEGLLGEMAVSAADLLDGEHSPIVRAVPRRQREFIGGRVLARTAMSRLGVAPQAIPAGSDRAPLWPSGLVGSITHSATWCAAAVALARDIRSVGIDVEDTNAIEPGLWEIVCTESEREWLSTLPAENRGAGAAVLFSAKEAFFKAQYPLTRRMLGHQDVRISVHPDWLVWQGTLTESTADPDAVRSLDGRLLMEAGRVATVAVIPLDPDRLSASPHPNRTTS